MTERSLSDIARSVFSEIEAANPAVTFIRPEDDIEGERLPRLQVQAQPSVSIALDLYVWSDELYLDCGGFHASWFPLRDRSIQEEFIERACGLIEGSHRVVEYSRGSKVVSADLQRIVDGTWKTVSGVTYLHWPWPRAKQSAILRNGARLQAN